MSHKMYNNNGKIIKTNNKNNKKNNIVNKLLHNN